MPARLDLFVAGIECQTTQLECPALRGGNGTFEADGDRIGHGLMAATAYQHRVRARLPHFHRTGSERMVCRDKHLPLFDPVGAGIAVVRQQVEDPPPAFGESTVQRSAKRGIMRDGLGRFKIKGAGHRDYDAARLHQHFRHAAKKGAVVPPRVQFTAVEQHPRDRSVVA